MSGKNKRIKPIKCWLSANDGHESRTGGFVQVGMSLLQDEIFCSLSEGAQILYIRLGAIAKGKNFFECPQGLAKSWKISPSSFWRRMHELEAAGFITLDSSGKTTRTNNQYSFTQKWKEKQPGRQKQVDP